MNILYKYNNVRELSLNVKMKSVNFCNILCLGFHNIYYDYYKCYFNYIIITC